jgi:hypothetical protein
VTELPGGGEPNAGQPIWRELDQPRPPTGHEARLLGELAAFVDEPRLPEQVRTVRVTATCRCGCSSLRLLTSAPAIPSERVAELSSSGRSDYVAVGSRARPRTLRHVDVVLHVVAGRISELEVFDTRRGEGIPVPVERVTGLQELRLS